VLPTVSAAVAALARVSRYAAWRDVPRVEPEAVDQVRAQAARATAAEMMTTGATVTEPAARGGEAGGWLTPGQVTRLLAPYGLSPLEGVTATGLTARAVADCPTELGQDGADVLGERVPEGLEMALGLLRDPTLGPLVVVTAGGSATYPGDDRVFLLPPLDAGAVSRAVRSLRSWPLLDGDRGSPRVDVDALERLVLALGSLGTDVPAVAEVHLDPVLVGADGTHLVGVEARLGSTAPVDTGVPRRLRPGPSRRR
jgi:hypothetical protein